jgi:ureidoglycolate lyase
MRPTRILQAAPLAAEPFAPYGEVLAPEAGRASVVNGGRALRFDGVASLQHSTGAAAPILSLYRIAPSDRPLRVDLFERHPHSSQIFLPLADSEFLVVVAPDRDGAPDPSRAQAFRPEPRTGIHYRPGIWHVPLAVFGTEAVFAMLMWEGGTADTVEHRLSAPLLVHL